MKSCAPTCVKRRKFEIGKPDPAYLLPEQEEGEPSRETLPATHRKVYAVLWAGRETTTEQSSRQLMDPDKTETISNTETALYSQWWWGLECMRAYVNLWPITGSKSLHTCLLWTLRLDQSTTNISSDLTFSWGIKNTPLLEDVLMKLLCSTWIELC